MKRLLKFMLKAIAVVVVLIVIFLGTVYTVNVFASKSEQSKIQPYGQSVAVDGKNMNVMIQGEGKETIVLIPGFGTASPALDFKPLIDQLSPHYKVVVVEPFGYGLSDVTDKPRTVDNITNEIHEALQQLKINKYILMGHSISGIYGLDYVNKYPNEVTAFAGIDTSFPTQPTEVMDTESISILKKSGFYRLLVKLNPSQIMTPDVDEATKEQIKMITLKNMMNPDIVSEAQLLPTNFKAVQGLQFPKNLPVIFFLVKDDPDIKNWTTQHEEQIKNSLHGKIVLLDGTHYLHYTQSKVMADDLKSFIDSTK
ncbi:alpha/beta hydrolase [Paenibacillus sp. CFBP13512]|uniref:alpha/beta hydrolase n=1 Tax=Paenibacillus sp. CFBP13512 TaxID=2184007 RepID=UPI0010BFA725|nr:alpha/beta hydrolase [Paenibacillus sp. CFBP13512]TKJ93374.1 alpha/beta hydrolase [Paenibacillus sp. CFBP13512]